MKFNRTLIAISLASALSACGSSSSDSKDTTAPVLTLTGSPNVTINLNATYVDAGATAKDDVDGTITVTTTGTVDQSTAGVYTLTYTATDAAGNKSTIVRKVTVVAPTTITGQAVKGVLANAKVTVYKFDENGDPVALDPTTELKDGEITTDNLGNYSFVVLDYTGPIKVELSPSTDPANPTTMICDAPAGCGDTAFGATIDLTVADPDFKLAAISIVDNESAGEVKMNVSALTHLAAELIEADDAGVTAGTVTEQSTKIANTFGIEGDITQLEATVTTDAGAVAGEDNEAELRLGLINAGIMAAMFSGETDDAAVLSKKLTKIAKDLIDNDGGLLVNQDEDKDGFELAISDVLKGASDAAASAGDLIKADDTLTGTEKILGELAQEETDLANEKAYQESNVGDDGLSEVVTEKLTDGDAVTKAKAMVSDVRLFKHLFDDTTAEGKGVKTQGEEYLDLMTKAGAMIELESESFNLLAQISNAIAALSAQHDAGTLSKVDAKSGIDIVTYLTTPGAVGTITFEEETATGGILFKVDATSGSEKVTLNTASEFTEDKKGITLSFDGSIESAGAMFTLKEGSLAQIKLDTAASRTALEDDTYQGELVSGELKLDITLEQKTTSTVTDPVTFSGMLHTKLLPVGERVLDEQRTESFVDNGNGQQVSEVNISYGRPEIETFILPEMLNLSGAFSSLEGDLIKATLTVNINDLADHKAPGFKYIGKEVDSIIGITISEDKNTVVITDADNISDKNKSTETRVLTPGGKTGEWTATSSVTAANAKEHNWGTGIERKIITKRFDSGLAEEGIRYTRAYILGTEDKQFGFKSILITPIDNDNNGSTDNYKFEAFNHRDGKSYDGTSLDTLIDANANILTSDGAIHPGGTAQNLGEYPSIEAFLKANANQLVANPLTVTNGAELLAQTITNWWSNKRSLIVNDIGIATSFFNEDELKDIAAGKFTELTPVAYLTEPLIKDAFTITVSDDGKNVVAKDSAHTRTFTMDYTSPGNFTFNRETHKNSNLEFSDQRTYATNDKGLDLKELTILRKRSFEGQEQSYVFTRITPVDDGHNGNVANDGKADKLIRSITFSDYINDNNVLSDKDGNPITESGPHFYADSYEQEPRNFFAPFNAFTTTNALSAYQSWLKNTRSSTLTTWVDDIGFIENRLSSEEINTLAVNSTTMFDGFNTEADARTSLEDKENFLKGNAALTLEAILGDYQVKVQLSGEKIALEDGKFNLDMSYRLPGADTQRSFAVQHDTTVKGRLTANNTDGVVLVLNEPDEDATGTQVLGRILVGPTAIVAATIEDRGNGLVVIVYSDETTETL